MPNQTNLIDDVRYADGVKVSYSKDGAPYVDIGACQGDVVNTFNFEKEEIQTANAGKLNSNIKNMTMASSFDLINLDPAVIADLSCGLITATETTTTPVTTSPNTVISSGTYADKQAIQLSIETSSTDSALLIASVEPTLSTVTGSVDGALSSALNDFTILYDLSSPSRYSIILNTDGTNFTTVAQDITIDYTSVTPVASTTLKAGTTQTTAEPIALKFSRVDSAGKTKTAIFPKCEVDPGALLIASYKGADTGGIDSVPMTFTALIDTDQTDGEQLFTSTEEAGSE